jgi:hypothetical protein
LVHPLRHTSCDFSKFEAGKIRYSWNWAGKAVDHTYRTNSVAAGVGALAVEAPKMLEWMHHYWVNVPYGAARWPNGKARAHFGALDGTVSWVAQFSRATTEYIDFGQNPDGSTNFAIQAPENGSCVISKGVDVIFTMNQDADASCTLENGCKVCLNDDCSKQGSAYSGAYYSSIVKRALARWTGRSDRSDGSAPARAPRASHLGRSHARRSGRDDGRGGPCGLEKRRRSVGGGGRTGTRGGGIARRATYAPIRQTLSGSSSSGLIVQTLSCGT